MQNYNFIGKNVTKIEGSPLVQGKTKYGTDISLPGMLYAKTCRCPYPHAKVVKIDTSLAQNFEGVIAVATAKDIKGLNLHGAPVVDQPVLIAEGEKAKMLGDPIAVVAAVSDKIAEEAAKLIEVEYEPLEVIDDPEKVLQFPEKYLIHDTAFCGSYDYEKGELEKAIEESNIIVEDVYKLPMQEHAYLEPESGVAIPESDGSLTVIGGLHDPFYLRYAIARSLGISESSVRVIIPQMGGSYGGKQTITVHILIALLALKTGRPVKMVWTRKESMLVSPKRHPFRIKHRIGATKEGKITFLQVDYLLDGGAYAWASGGVAYFAGAHFVGPYKIPNVSIHGKAVYTNNPMAGAFRGFGVPQAVVVTEMQLNRLAKKLNIDPIIIREINYLTQEEEPGVDGLCLDTKITSGLCLQKVLGKAGSKPDPSSPMKKVGRGIASTMMLYDISAEAVQDMRGTGATIELFRDGSIDVRTGSVEMGNGLNTVLAQITANELGVSLNKIRVINADTQRVPKSGPTVASRGAYTSGNAVKIAAQELKRRLADVAVQKFGNYPITSGVCFANDYIYANQSREKSISISELAEFCYLNGINLVSNSWFSSDHASWGQSFGAAVIDVEVDVQTGETTVLNCIMAHDCGKALNPLNARSQLVGSGVQGIGYALMEEMFINKGKLETDTLQSYLVPTSLDIPNIEVIFVEEPYPSGPYGARGLGEHGLALTPGALLNAIADAIGKDINEFPATPDRILGYIGN